MLAVLHSSISTSTPSPPFQLISDLEFEAQASEPVTRLPGDDAVRNGSGTTSELPVKTKIGQWTSSNFGPFRRFEMRRIYSDLGKYAMQSM